MCTNMQQALYTAKKAINFDKEGNKILALQSYEEAVNSLKQSISLNEARSQEIHNELQRQLAIYTDKISELKQVVFQSDDKRQDEYEDPELVKRVESAIVHVDPNVNFDSVSGLEQEKEFLNQAIVLPIQYPWLFVDDVQPYNGFLLFGPPGTGKSHLAKATAGQAKGTTFYSLSASDLVSKYQGESENLIKSLFASARKRRPSIIFIDEIDSLAMSRTESDGDGSRRIKTELFIQMQGAKSSNAGVFVLAASNTPQNLDDAVLRRFDKLLYIPLPCFDARKDMIYMRFTKTIGLTEEFVSDIAAKTEGFSGSDIDIIAKKAKMESLARLSNSSYFKKVNVSGNQFYTPCNSGSKGAIKMKHSDVPKGRLLYSIIATTDDILKSVREAVPRVDECKVRQFERFAEENAEKITKPAPEYKPKKKSKMSTFFSVIFNILD